MNPRSRFSFLLAGLALITGSPLGFDISRGPGFRTATTCGRNIKSRRFRKRRHPRGKKH